MDNTIKQRQINKINNYIRDNKQPYYLPIQLCDEPFNNGTNYPSYTGKITMEYMKSKGYEYVKYSIYFDDKQLSKNKMIFFHPNLLRVMKLDKLKKEIEQNIIN